MTQALSNAWVHELWQEIARLCQVSIIIKSSDFYVLPTLDPIPRYIKYIYYECCDPDTWTSTTFLIAICIVLRSCGFHSIFDLIV